MMTTTVLSVVASVVAIVAAAKAIYTVETGTLGVLQRFGKFQRICHPGLGFKIPFVDQVVARLSLRIEPLKVGVETKTKDNVFVQLPVVVQYQVLPEKAYEAYYKLSDVEGQVTALVADVVRSEVPKLTLDQAFESKEEVATALKTSLAEHMDDFGYRILSVQILDVEPEASVKAAMNKINAAQRLQAAAQSEAEAEKIKVVKAAEAEAEKMKLEGKGIADQRHAIIAGLKSSVEEFQQAIQGSNPSDVMNMIMMTQYFDTLKSIGDESRVILLPHSPGGMSDLQSQIRSAIISGSEAARS